MKYIQIGMELALSVLLGIYAGHRADSLFGMKPWGTLCGLALGMFAGFYLFYREVR